MGYGIGDVGDWVDKNKKRIAVGVATGGLSEAGGARTGVEAVTGTDPAEVVGVKPEDVITDIAAPVLEPINKLVAGAQDMFTGPQATAWTPQQGAGSAFGDPNYAPTQAGNYVALGGDYRTQAGNAQGRGIDPYLQPQGQARDQLSLDAQALRDYANRGPGPSVAQAQLQLAQADNERQALSMARNTRGIGQNAAVRNAATEQARIGGQTAGQMGVLRAQEEDMWRQRELQARTQASQITDSIRQGDFKAVDSLLQNKQINDALSVALGEQGLTADKLAQMWAQMDQDGRIQMQQLLQDAFMRAQETNINSDAQRDAATIAALGGVAEAGLAMTGQMARAAGDAVPL